MILINVFILKESFVDLSFSNTLKSLITIDPGDYNSRETFDAKPYSPTPYDNSEYKKLANDVYKSVPQSSPSMPSPSMPSPSMPSPSMPSPSISSPSMPSPSMPSPSMPSPSMSTQSSIGTQPPQTVANDALVQTIRQNLKADINEAIQALKMEQLQKAPSADIKPTGGSVSDVTAQGKDFRNIKDANLASVDMNDYIRKDEIPCWGCSIPTDN